jgi:hypothetical protein
MLEIAFVTLLAAFLSDAEDYLDDMRSVGRGKTGQHWEPEKRLVLARKIDKEPWWVTEHRPVSVPGGDPQLVLLVLEVLRSLKPGFRQGGTVRRGRWLVEVEGWSGACVDEGWGPWSGCAPWREGVDPSAFLPEDDEFLANCIAEDMIRKMAIEPGYMDGPPLGAKRWLLDLWLGAIEPHYLVQVRVWEVE